MPFLTPDKIVSALGEHQALNLWEVVLEVNSGSGVSIPSDLLLRCTSVEMPQEEVTFKETKVGRYTISQPADVSRNGEMTLRITEAEDAKAANAMEQLKMSIWNNEGISKGWANLRGTAFIYLMSSTGKKTQGYKLQYCSFVPVWLSDSLGQDPNVAELGIKVKYNWWTYLKQ